VLIRSRGRGGRGAALSAVGSRRVPVGK
jgi:hypothetical protein